MVGSFKGVSNDENHPVITGKTAFFSVSSNASTILSSKAGRTIKLLPLPKAGDKEGRFIKPSMFLAVSSYSKYPEEAAKFINFFINNEAANDILKGERGVPVSSVIAAQLSGKLGEGENNSTSCLTTSRLIHHQSILLLQAVPWLLTMPIKSSWIVCWTAA